MKFYPLLIVSFIAFLLVIPVYAADTSDQINSAGSLYSDSVDLANEGRYQEALDTADKALAMNVTSLTGLIQSNRAGILVMLGRNEEAIAAADAALAVEGDLTTVHSIAWYNKGNALRNLGRTAEAQDAYDKAYALDSTLVPPEMGGYVPVTSATKSPLSPLTVLGALGSAAGGVAVMRNKSRL